MFTRENSFAISDNFNFLNRYQLPDIKGFKDLWGKSIFHCPYCHGYEDRQKRLGLIANGKFLEHLMPMIFSLSKDLIIFTNGAVDPPKESIAKLADNHLRLVETLIKELEYVGTQLHKIVLDDDTKIERDGLFLAPKVPFELKSNIGEKLGCQKTEFGFYKIDVFLKTTTEGVFAGGDITSPMHSVLSAAASGQFAGVAAVSEILSEDFSNRI